MSVPVPCLTPSPRISLTLVAAVAGGPVGLQADPIISSSPDNGFQSNSDGMYAPSRPPVAGALPGSPFDGQEVYYHDTSQDSAIKWHLRYAAGSSNVYKWEFLGGPTLHSETQGGDSLNGQGDANFHILANGPSVTAPLDGVYDIYMSALINPTNATNAGGQRYGFGAQYCGNLPGDADACVWYPSSGGSSTSYGQIHLSMTLRGRTCCGGQLVRMTYANQNNLNTNPVVYSQRVVAIQPVRVG